MVCCIRWAGLNDGLSQKRCTIKLVGPSRDLPSVLTGHTWQIVYLSYTDPCPTIAIHKSEIKVP